MAAEILPAASVCRTLTVLRPKAATNGSVDQLRQLSVPATRYSTSAPVSVADTSSVGSVVTPSVLLTPLSFRSWISGADADVSTVKSNAADVADTFPARSTCRTITEFAPWAGVNAELHVSLPARRYSTLAPVSRPVKASVPLRVMRSVALVPLSSNSRGVMALTCES